MNSYQENVKSNLLNMGWLEMVTEALAELGIDLEDLAEVDQIWRWGMAV